LRRFRLSEARSEWNISQMFNLVTHRGVVAARTRSLLMIE
jgi:hypothetical protein